MFRIGITDHLEGPRDRDSKQIFAEVISQTELADQLGFDYAWFAEHHGHAHLGHMPTPLLLALHVAGRTRQIRLGTAIICLNLHHAIDVAEQVAVADSLMNGRGAFGFGSGSTPQECELFGVPFADDADRHRRFESALMQVKTAWAGSLPVAGADLAARSWLAVNSVAAAQIAGRLGFNMLYSHLRTPAQYCEYHTAYRAAGGSGLIAANRPVHVAKDDAAAFARAHLPIRTLWRRFRAEGKIDAAAPEPAGIEDLCGHPLNFIVGGPATVARALRELREQAYFDVANLEVRWDGFSAEQIADCMHWLAEARSLAAPLAARCAL